VEARGGEELTLTLLRPEGASLNASAVVDGELSLVVSELVDELLAQRALSPSAASSAAATQLDPPAEPKHPHAWKAGPILLIAGGSAAFVAIGVGAATKRDEQQLDTSAVAAWSAVGAAALAGGVTWWVVDAKRRQKGVRVALSPTKIDLRLRF
jgi:hypothetical protein